MPGGNVGKRYREYDRDAELPFWSLMKPSNDMVNPMINFAHHVNSVCTHWSANSLQ